MSILALICSAVLLSQAGQDPEADRLRKEVEKLKADHAAVQRQLETALAQLQELNDKIAKQRAAAPATTAGKPFDEWKAEEERRLQVVRGLEKLKTPEIIPHKGLVPVPGVPAPVVTPRTVPETKITAVAPEIGLVVISMGAEDGVVEGQTYAITRGGESVGTMTIDRVDRKWAAGKVTRKISEPRVGDVVGGEKAPPKATTTLYGTHFYGTSSEELKAIRKELDDVRGQVQSLTDRILPSWKDLGVTVEEASETLCAQFQIARGLVIRRVREGSPAARILKANDVITDRTEAQMMEVFRSGGTLPLRRQGKLEVFQVDPTR